MMNMSSCFDKQAIGTSTSGLYEQALFEADNAGEGEESIITVSDIEP